MASIYIKANSGASRSTGELTDEQAVEVLLELAMSINRYGGAWAYRDLPRGRIDLDYIGSGSWITARLDCDSIPSEIAASGMAIVKTTN